MSAWTSASSPSTLAASADAASGSRSQAVSDSGTLSLPGRPFRRLVRDPRRLPAGDPEMEPEGARARRQRCRLRRRPRRRRASCCGRRSARRGLRRPGTQPSGQVPCVAGSGRRRAQHGKSVRSSLLAGSRAAMAGRIHTGAILGNQARDVDSHSVRSWDPEHARHRLPPGQDA